MYNNYSYNNTYKNYSPSYSPSSYSYSYSDSTYTPSSYSYSSYDNSTGGYNYQNSENQYNTTENTTQYNQPVTPYISYPTTINSIKPSIESAPTTTTSTASTTPVAQIESATTTKTTPVTVQTTDIDGKNIKTATIGTYSDSVMNLQKFLAQKGFYTGDIDGIMTIEVLRALRAYQSDKGIGQTGRIDLATQIQIEKDLGL